MNAKKKIKKDKKFIVIRQLHPASEKITTDFPIKVRNMDGDNNYVENILNVIESHLDDPWEVGMLEMLPGWFKKKDTWRTKLHSMLSAREVESYLEVKEGVMRMKAHNKRTGFYVDVEYAYEKVKTMRDFLDIFDPRLNMKVLDNLKQSVG